MTTTLAIKAFFVKLRAWAPDLPFIDPEIFDSELTFDPALRREIAMKDQLVQSLVGKPGWVATLWNRENISPFQDQGRQHRLSQRGSSLVGEADVHSARIVQVPLTLSIFSPSAELIENFEEAALADRPDGSFSFSQEGQNVTGSLNDFAVTGLICQKNDAYGAIFNLTATVQLVFPVSRKLYKKKLVLEPVVQVYT